MRFKVPKFARKMISNYISKAVEEETGIRMDVNIGVMAIDTKGKDYTLCMAETISVNKKNLKKFINENIKNEP